MRPVPRLGKAKHMRVVYQCYAHHSHTMSCCVLRPVVLQDCVPTHVTPAHGTSYSRLRIRSYGIRLLPNALGCKHCPNQHDHDHVRLSEVQACLGAVEPKTWKHKVLEHIVELQPLEGLHRYIFKLARTFLLTQCRHSQSVQTNVDLALLHVYNCYTTRTFRK